MATDRTLHILVARPDSYLGYRLVHRLLVEPDVRIRLLTRDARRIAGEGHERVEVFEGEPLDPDTLARAARGIDVAYFPTRFLRSDHVDVGRNRRFARLFRDACAAEGVDRIVFLGVRSGRAPENRALRSVSEVGSILSGRPDAIRTVCLRNDYILGSGSLLFEALRGMARGGPVLLAPRWMDARPEVTGVADTLEYLALSARLPLDRSLVVDIGRPSASVLQLAAMTAGAMGLRRTVLRLPVVGTRPAALLLTLGSPLSYRLARSFVCAMQAVGSPSGDTGGEPAERVFPSVVPTPPEAAIGRALLAIGEDRVESRWTDSLAGRIDTDADAAMAEAPFRDVRTARFGDVPPERVFRAFTSIGGSRGWFTFDRLWRVRGFLDKLAGGYGIAVGRRTASSLRIGDYLDVWKVIDLRENRRLLLEAQMKVAGKAWLEFRIEGDTLVQTACHRPDGLAGRLYWYAMVPFHAFIFRDMVRCIVRRAAESNEEAAPGGAGPPPPGGNR